MKDVEVYSVGIVCASVCAHNKLPAGKVQFLVNKQSPSGTRNGWVISEENFTDGSPNPCPCDQDPENRKHYLFNC